MCLFKEHIVVEEKPEKEVIGNNKRERRTIRQKAWCHVNPEERFKKVLVNGV